MVIRTCSDLEEAGRIWNSLWPPDDIFDCWDVRECFQRSYERPLHFIVAESAGRVVGFMGLSRIDEHDYYGQFPGETWQGSTWFEQNRIPADSSSIGRMLWDAAPEGTRLRYLVADSADYLAGSSVDETGYLFHPPQFGYDFGMYWKTFSGKSRKRLGREIDSLGELDYSQNGGEPGDIEWMFETNRANFGDKSYFEDPRFLEGFESMLSLLAERGMLTVTTVQARGRRAAVDVGVVFGKRCTILAGATDNEFPGIAKAMNLFHIRRGCEMRFEQIDFLCGDFGWKERFHLKPRPLYISIRDELRESINASSERKAGSVLCS